MLTKLRFGKRLIRVASAGVEHTATVELAVPGDGVSRAILPAFVGGLVQFTQYLDACCDALVVVPFVGAQPAVGEMARSWMVFVFHDDCCLLGFGVTFEVRADQFVIPGPVVLSICCGMYANKSTATAD